MSIFGLLWGSATNIAEWSRRLCWHHIQNSAYIDILFDCGHALWRCLPLHYTFTSTTHLLFTRVTMGGWPWREHHTINNLNDIQGLNYFRHWGERMRRMTCVWHSPISGHLGPRINESHLQYRCKCAFSAPSVPITRGGCAHTEDVAMCRAKGKRCECR